MWPRNKTKKKGGDKIKGRNCYKKASAAEQLPANRKRASDSEEATCPERIKNPGKPEWHPRIADSNQMAADRGECTQEKKKEKQKVATGGAEQERKGVPWCVRVSVPVRPELCLSDRQRQEKKTREKRRSFSQNKKREVCVSQTRTRQKFGGSGGWVGASSSRRSMQVACAFRSSHGERR